MKKLLIIQPHSDDALFSASFALFLPTIEVQVLTIENDYKRAEEDRQLYSFLNIPIHFLDLDLIDDSYYKHFKDFGNKDVNSENANRTLLRTLGRRTMDAIEYEINSFITRFLKENSGYEILIPLGIGHPFHLFVREIFERRMGLLHYYREFPHSYKKRICNERVIFIPILALKSIGD